MGKMGGTLEHHWKIVVVSNFMCHQQIAFKMLTQSSSFLPIFLFDISHQRIISIIQKQTFLPSYKAHRQLYHLEYGDRTKNTLVKIAELLGIATKNPLLLFQLQLQHLI